jgi:hypothetical protein
MLGSWMLTLKLTNKKITKSRPDKTQFLDNRYLIILPTKFFAILTCIL